MSEIDIFYPLNIAAWREWLLANHQHKQSVWVVFYSKSSQKPTISWSEAVDVALCYGWIDSKKVKIDPESSHQFFSKRKANSTWSKINKAKVQKLRDDGLMAQAGLDCVALAKQNGSWNLLNEVEELIIPLDLDNAFNTYKDSRNYFLSLSKSTRKMMLQWIVLAKRAETRQKRIDEIANLAGQKKKPKPF